MPRRRSSVRFPFGLLLACALVTGCGGGGGGSAPAAPQGTPTPAALITSDAYTGAAKTIPLTGGIDTILVPASTTAPPAGTTVTITTNVVPPPGFAPLQSALRRTSSVWTGQIASFYITVTFSASVTLTAFPGFTFSLAGPPANPEFIAYFDPAKATWNMNADGQGIVNGATVTFPATPGTFPFLAGVAYDFVLYRSPTASPSPSPNPTPSPAPTPSGPTPTPSPSPSPTLTPTPSPTPTASPSPVADAMTITPSSQLPVSPQGSNTFLIQDYLSGGAPYTGTFTKTADTCLGATANATYATSNFDPTKPGPTQTVTVTGGNLGGNRFLTFSDGTRQASVNIIKYAGNFQPH